MQLYLFGGYSSENEREHWQLLSKYLNTITPKQVLFVGFAEISMSPEENYLRFTNNIAWKLRPEVLQAEDIHDLQKANKPLIFVSGGNGHRELIEASTRNGMLKNILLISDYFFGDSAGAMVAGSWQRKLGNGSPLIEGLGLVANTIIEPHYTQRKRIEQLRDEMKTYHCDNGIGIDEVSGIRIRPEEFPQKYEKLGKNKVEVLTMSH